MSDLLLQWAGNGFILLGTWLLARRQRYVLVIYSLGNLCWILSGIHARIWPIVFLDLTLTAFNVRAWIKWGQS